MDLHGYTKFDAATAEALGKRWSKLWAQWHWLIEPVFHGHEHVHQSTPALWVGNHSLMAFADAGLMFKALYDQHGIVLRALGQHAHFKVPIWKTRMLENGVVDGTRQNCTAMMQAGEHILVYPGGGGEVMKRHGEQHTLRWKNRTGFARLALENNYPIQPFATVGADDCWDIVYDNKRFSDTRLGEWAIEKANLKAEELPPLIKGWGPTLLPKPQRMYFKFFPQIHPSEFAHLPLEDAAWAMRKKVEQVVTDGIQELLDERDSDPKNKLGSRLRDKLKHRLSR